MALLRRAIPLSAAILLATVAGGLLGQGGNATPHTPVQAWVGDGEGHRCSLGRCIGISARPRKAGRRRGVGAETAGTRLLVRIEQYRSIQKFYYGDYYPLTAYSHAKNVWMAYQLDLPESGEELVVVLRRPESPENCQSFRLHELEPDATYQVTDLDSAQSQTLSGHQLIDSGLEVRLAKQPDSALIRYRHLSR